MTKMKMLCLIIKIKKNDEIHGKRLYKKLLDFMMDAGISGATVVSAIDGFGRRGKSTIHIEGISINHPVIIEAIDEKSKIEQFLPQIKRMVDDNGIVTLHEVYLLCAKVSVIISDYNNIFIISFDIIQYQYIIALFSK